MRQALVVLMFVCLSAPAMAGTYFYESGGVFGARGWVVEVLHVSDGRRGVTIDVGGTTYAVPCSSSAAQYDQNSASVSDVCGLALTEPCSGTHTPFAGSAGSLQFEGASCSGRGKCVSISGMLTSGEYLAEGASVRPVASVIYERPASACN